MPEEVEIPKSDLAILNLEDKPDEKDDEKEKEEDGKETGDNESEGDGESSEDGEDVLDPDDEDDEEDDNENEEESEEDDELDSSLFKKLNKSDPKLFKKYPELRDVIDREAKYTETFGTPEEAVLADSNSKLLGKMWNDISSGKVEGTNRFLTAIKSTDSEAFEEFAHTFIPAIAKLSPELYGEVLKVPIKKALQSAFLDATKAGNKNLAASLIWVHEYYFDSRDIKASFEERKGKKDRSPELEQVEKERQSFREEKLTVFRTDIQEAINHSLRNSINKTLEGLEIDDYKKRNIVKDIFEEIDGSLGKDTRHLASFNSLVTQATSAGLTKEWKSRLISAYLGRAKSSLSAARLKVLKEAGIKLKESKQEVRRLTPGSGNSNDKITFDFKNVDRAKTSDMDILNDTPKLLRK